MKNKNNSLSISAWILIILQFLLGLGALGGGGVLMAAPDGSIMQMPLDMLKYSPFPNFLIPGIILFCFLGIYPVAIAYSLWQRPAWGWPDRINPFKKMHWSWAASLSAGVILVIWITVEMLLTQSAAFIQIFYFVWGWALVLLPFVPGVRGCYRR
jgi:hypothetical protein